MASKEMESDIAHALCDLAEKFREGEALTAKKIAKVCSLRDLSPKYSKNITSGIFRGRRFAEATGIEVEATKYRREHIYYDFSKDLETETNISKVREEIDQEYERKRKGKRKG